MRMQVIAAVDATAVAVYVASKSHPEGCEGAALKADMDARKGALIEALHQKCQCGSPCPNRRPSYRVARQ